jgi:hypothetical protein
MKNVFPFIEGFDCMNDLFSNRMLKYTIIVVVTLTAFITT